MKRRFKYLIVAYVLSTLFLAFFGAYVLIQIPIILVAGWALFLAETLPNVTIDIPAVTLALIALCILVVGVHLVGRRCRKSWFAASPNDTAVEPQLWRFRWTLLLVASLALVFVAGISVVGAVHQLVWLGTSSDPVVENSFEGMTSQLRSRNNMKYLGLACHDYHDHHETFPKGGTMDTNGRLMHSWATFLLPYIEQQPLFDSIDQSHPWNHEANTELFSTVVPPLTNSYIPLEDERLARAHYAANLRVFRLGNSLQESDFSDGLSNTILLGEVASKFRAWGDPLNVRDPAQGLNTHADGFGSPYKSDYNRQQVGFLFADGSVRTVSENIDPDVLKAISTPAAGDPVSEF